MPADQMKGVAGLIRHQPKANPNIRAVAAGLGLAVAQVATAVTAPMPRTVSLDQAIDASIGGSVVRLLPMANGGRIILNPAAAERLRTKPGLFQAQARVGPIRVAGASAVVSATVDGIAAKQRILWFERSIAPEYDGAIGPGDIPAPVVTFRLSDPVPGEVRYALPMVSQELSRLGTTVEIAGEPVQVSWDLTRAASLATAATGADLSRANGGRLEGAGWREPIRLGISRPARKLVLATPLAIGPLRLGSVVTRVSDYGDSSAIPDGDADQSEIVVSAKGKSKPDHSLLVGRDAMRFCSSITFDKPAKRIVLQCVPR